jgi:Type I phosphodiesterase / nucleotide pyrophosphatase
MSEEHDVNHQPDRDLPWDRAITRRDLLRYGGMLGFGAVGASMLAACSPAANLGAPIATGTVPPATAKYLAVVIVDGCRPDYLSYGHLPNLRAMLGRGTFYTNAWSGITQAITPACHASLNTGLFPKNDGGILGFWWENPNNQRYGECANLADSRDPSRPEGRTAIDADSLSRLLKQSQSPTMAGLLKQVDPTAKVYTSSGVKFYAADAAGGPDADYITYYWNDGPNTYRPLSIPGHELPPGILDDPSLRTNNYTTMNYGVTGQPAAGHPGLQDTLVVDLATKVIRQQRPRIVILNLPEMDYPFGHLNGGPHNPGYVRAIMESADNAIGKLFQTYKDLGIFHQTMFAFLGDHGMIPLQQQVDNRPIWTAAQKAGTSVVGADCHSAGFVWIADPGKALKTSEYIDSFRMPGVAAVYFLAGVSGGREYLPSPQTASSITPQLDAAYRYLLGTMAGSNAPHVVLLYPERTGTVGAGAPAKWLGDHGGPSWASQSIPLVLAGPGIRRGRQSTFPARLVDIAPTLLRLLGVPYPNLDGVALADAFRRPFASERAALNQIATQLTPLAATLKRQSVLDVQYLMTHKPVNPPPATGPGEGTGSGNPTKTPPPTVVPPPNY